MTSNSEIASKIAITSLLVIVAFSATLGCSSDQGNAKAGTGTGTTAVDGYWEDRGTALKQFGVFLSSYSHECALKQAGTGTPNSTIVELDFTPPTGQTTVPPGTYTVLPDDAPGAATAQHKVRDASCNNTKVDATTGSITLTSPLGVGSSSTVSGSYSVHFEDGADLSGNFSGSGFCDTNVVGTPGPACHP